ncbi:MAG TPA: hypothetical protein EYQ60_10530, partial [Myxococcales bacterium]|nr:hypothetical protein [Myxococcales bacterium]
MKRAALTVTLGIAIRSRVSIFQSLQILAPCLLVSNKTVISKALRLRKMLGGGMRQVGVIASCGM